MSADPLTRNGRLLWQLLPRIYRRMDGVHARDPRVPTREIESRGDLALLLDCFGALLDEIGGSLEQRLRDTSPDTCQPWLIPYFADLLDVKLVSPDVDGQRQEVARAVSWRQRKGTLPATLEIAREIGRFERDVVVASPEGDVLASLPTVTVQEGWRRVVTTAQIGLPLPSLRALGLPADAYTPVGSPSVAALRPGLPQGTIDFRFSSRARRLDSPTAVSRQNAFGNEGLHWQQERRRGAPCEPGTYQDASARTVDVRTPGWARGHHHPHRVLLHSAPRDGFFPPGQPTFPWDWTAAFTGWTDSFAVRDDIDGSELWERTVTIDAGGEEHVLIEREVRRGGALVATQRLRGVAAGDGVAVRVERVGIDVPGGETVEVVEIAFAACVERIEQHLDDGSLRITLRGAGTKPVRLTSAATADLAAAAHDVALEDLVLPVELVVHARTFSALRCAFDELDVSITGAPPALPRAGSAPFASPVRLRDCLAIRLSVPTGHLAQLECCTVLERLRTPRLEASDCILVDDPPGPFEELFVRYCSTGALIPPGGARPPTRTFESDVFESPPLFIDTAFGAPGCGVLHPGASPSLRLGAEDGGERGAYHHLHYVLREEAVLDKLRGFLPVTLEPVLVPHLPFTAPAPRHTS